MFSSFSISLEMKVFYVNQLLLIVKKRRKKGTRNKHHVAIVTYNNCLKVTNKEIKHPIHIASQ